MIQTYNITSCDVSCDYGHVSLHHCQDYKKWTWFLSHFFYFLFYLFSFFYFQYLGLVTTQVTWYIEGSRRVTSYHMLTSWLTHGHLRQVRNNQHEPQGFSIERQTILCRVLYQVLLCYPNTRLPLNLTLKALSYNIKTQFLSFRLLNTSTLKKTLTLYSSLTERQHCLLVKKTQPGPRLKGNTSQAGEAQPFVCIKAHQCISNILLFYRCACYYLSLINLVLQALLWSIYAEE